MSGDVREYALHGLTLALAWFFIVNVAAGSFTLAIARMNAAGRRPGSSTFWLALRLAPAAAAMLFVTALFLPSYWRYEPREIDERLDVLLLICAAAAAAAIAIAAFQAVRAWASAVRRTRAWMRNARPLEIAGTPIPAFEVDADTPVMALVGVLRPRLLVTRGLIGALSAEELAASVAHELGHTRGRDNLKRLLIRAAPDVFAATAAARAIEQRWAASAEHHADAMATGGDPNLRCALASALVKVARLAPVPARAVAEPISTLVGGGEIAARVQRLLDEPPDSGERRSRRRGRPCTMVIAVFAMAAVGYLPLLRVVHDATEILVRLLP